MPLVRIGAALSGMFKGGEGPDHGVVDNAIDWAGIDRARVRASPKHARVSEALRNAPTEEAGRRLIVELIDALRLNGDLDPRGEEALRRVTKLREAITEAGGTLDAEGNFSWNTAAPVAHAAAPGGLSQPQPPTPPTQAPVPPPPSPAVVPSFELLLDMLRRVPHAARPLVGPRRHGKATVEVRDEYDAQDFVGFTLRLLFEDTRAEEVVPSYAGKSARTDFLIKKDSIVVEVKVTRAGRDHKPIIDEIMIDQRAYEKHPDAGHLVVVVYDLVGNIGNPAAMENDLRITSGPLPSTVLVVRWPEAT